jgi:hypothetical protein
VKKQIAVTIPRQLTPSIPPVNNIQTVRRLPFILLFIAYLASGQISIQQIHERQAQHEWQAQIARLLASGSLPNHQIPAVPRHDSSTCILCNLLHAPAKISLDIAGPTTPISRLAIANIFSTNRIDSSPSHCRGPPLA